MAEAIGIHVDDNIETITLPPMDKAVKEKAEACLRDKDKGLILINPNASSLCELRKWPAKHFASLADTLIERYGDYNIAMIGAPSERDHVSMVVALMTHKSDIQNLAGATDFKTLLALLERTNMLISNDSGPVHLAAGYGANTVVLFGPETPILYKPLNPNSRVLYENIYCSPCINVLDNKKNFEECENVRCMERITVESVIASVESLLDGNYG